MFWFCMQGLLFWDSWFLCVRSCTKEPDVITYGTFLGKGPKWASSSCFERCSVHICTSWNRVVCGLKPHWHLTHNLALFEMLQHLELVLLWDFWISILNVCARVGVLPPCDLMYSMHTLCKVANIKQRVRVVLVVLLQSWCYLFENLGSSVLLCESDVLLHTQTFGGRNVLLLKAIRMRWDSVVLLV